MFIGAGVERRHATARVVRVVGKDGGECHGNGGGNEMRII
jgi:hypothetical protein